MSQRPKVCSIEPLSKDKFQTQLAAGWSRVWTKLGSKPAMASKMGLNDTSVIDRGVTAANLPAAHTVFNSLCADPTALDEVLKQYGMRAVPIQCDAANDLATAAGTVTAMGELIGRLADGIRCHNDTLAIDALLRPHMPALTAILHDADRLRAAS